MGVEGEEAQPKKTGNRRHVETMLGWASEEPAGKALYKTTIITSLFEYLIVFFFGVWLIVEYLSNVYEQQYFGSFNPVFLVVVLMMASGYGFTRLVSIARNTLGQNKAQESEDDY